MKKIFLVLLTQLVIGGGVWAAENREIRPSISFGSGVLFEKNSDSQGDSSRLPLSFAVGAQVLSWSARVEYSSFKTTDGNNSLSVAREVETVFAWASQSLADESGWRPFIAIALGTARTTVETRLGQSFELSRGRPSGAFAAAVGAQALWAPYLMMRPELRYESAEDYKTKDARWGVFVSLDWVL